MLAVTLVKIIYGYPERISLYDKLRTSKEPLIVLRTSKREGAAASLSAECKSISAIVAGSISVTATLGRVRIETSRRRKSFHDVRGLGIRAVSV